MHYGTDALIILFVLLSVSCHAKEGSNETVIPAVKGEHGRVRVMKARVTYYCARGSGCNDPICGTNKKTAWGRDASKGDGCAVDKRRIHFGSKVTIDGRTYICDDTFGRAQRERDWKAGITHIDIRVAGKSHREVARMGADWKTVTVEEARGN